MTPGSVHVCNIYVLLFLGYLRTIRNLNNTFLVLLISIHACK